jgi:hypothetical protein
MRAASGEGGILICIVLSQQRAEGNSEAEKSKGKRPSWCLMP